MYENITLQVMTAYHSLMQLHDIAHKTQQDPGYPEWRKNVELCVKIVQLVNTFCPDVEVARSLRAVARTGFFSAGGALVGRLAFNFLPLQIGFETCGAPMSSHKGAIELASKTPETLMRLEGGKADFRIVEMDPALLRRTHYAVALAEEGVPIRIPCPEYYALNCLLLGDALSLSQAEWLLKTMPDQRPFELWQACQEFQISHGRVKELIKQLPSGPQIISEMEDEFGSIHLPIDNDVMAYRNIDERVPMPPAPKKV